MAFKKGNKHGKGRPKGSPNKVTEEARSLFIHVMEGEVSNIQDALDGLRDESADKYLRALAHLFPYFMPKQQELSVVMEVEPTEPTWFEDVIERTDQKESNLTNDTDTASM